MSNYFWYADEQQRITVRAIRSNLIMLSRKRLNETFTTDLQTLYLKQGQNFHKISRLTHLNQKYCLQNATA